MSKSYLDLAGQINTIIIIRDARRIILLSTNQAKHNTNLRSLLNNYFIIKFFKKIRIKDVKLT